MTAKEYLRQAYLLDQRIEAKLFQLQSLKELALKCTSVMTGMPHSPNHGGSRLEDTITKIVDMQAEINNDIDRLVDLKQEISERIAALDNPQQQAILMMRYIGCKNWAEISVELGYNLRYVYRVHSEALRALELATKCQ